MARVNFREVADRFTHIDATLLALEVTSSDQGMQCSLTVRFYPWWEHPLYRAAVDAGETWGFLDCEEGARDVIVIPKDVLAVRLTACASVTDWDFAEFHPALWEFEEPVTVFLNSTVSASAVVDELLMTRRPYCGRSQFESLLGDGPTPRAVQLPASVFALVEPILLRQGVSIFVPHHPGQAHPRAALVLDGEDYIIAEDFDLEVPEFEHRPEWFKP